MKSRSDAPTKVVSDSRGSASERTPREVLLSFFREDLGPGEVFFHAGQLLPRALVPKCEHTDIPEPACHCPLHGGPE